MSKSSHIYMPKDHMNGLYNAKNPLVRFVHNQRLNLIVNNIPLSQNLLNLLDAGCGEGHLIEKINIKNNNFNFFGIDITDIAVNSSKLRCPFANITKSDLSSIDYPNEFFDIVTCTEVLEHIHDYKQVLNEFQRVLKPSGILILTFPNEFWWTVSRFFLRRKPIKIPDHVNSFSPNTLGINISLNKIRQINLPFRLPFYISLGSLIIFKKT